VVIGETVIEDPDRDPGIHWNIPPGAEVVAVRTVEEPWQIVAFGTVTTGAGLTVTVTGADVPPHVDVTLYVPEVVTVILCDVALLLQVFPEGMLEVRTTLPPAQNVSGPLAVIIGGVLPTATVTESLTTQWVPVTVTVNVVVALISAVGFAMFGFDTAAAGAQLYARNTGGASIVLNLILGLLLLEVIYGVPEHTVELSAT
jgi:hypothetical protein